MKVLGTCGNCGGMVTVPTVWYGIFPPTPRCGQCGAVPKDTFKTIEMEPGSSGAAKLPEQLKLRIQSSNFMNIVKDICK